MADGIRSYGPGKFDTLIDSYAYDVTMDGVDEEAGDVSEHGVWYGLIRLDKQTRDHIRDQVEGLLTDEESELLDESAAIIFSENEQGFVTAEWFDNKQEAEDEWADIEEEFADDDEETD
jgi:hypothetical protein